MALRKLILYHLAESPRFQKFAVRTVVKIEEYVAKSMVELEESLEIVVKSEKIDPETKRFCETTTKEMTEGLPRMNIQMALIDCLGRFPKTRVDDEILCPRFAYVVDEQHLNLSGDSKLICV